MLVGFPSVGIQASPTYEDIVRGDALNALLLDLSDPLISSSSWRFAQVPLPAGVSIRSLFFRFAPKLGDKSSTTLSGNLIALGRLDQSKGWPIYLPEDKLGAERRAYEAAYRRLLDQCEKGKLNLDDVIRLDATIVALKSKVKIAVPDTRKFRETAVRHVDYMQAATKIFDASTIDFVQEMIRDTHDFQPQTVGELLAFMRKYRLLFASAEGRPDDGDLYLLLHGLLRQQKEGLERGTEDKPATVAKRAQQTASPATPAAELKTAKDQLNEAKAELSKTNFRGLPDRRDLKLHALEKVNAAITAVEKGGLTKAPIEDALKDINSLLNDGAKMAKGNRDHLERTAERLSALLADLK